MTPSLATTWLCGPDTCGPAGLAQVTDGVRLAEWLGCLVLMLVISWVS